MAGSTEYAVVFTRAATVLSWLIQMRTRGAVSHCGFVVKDAAGVTVYQAGGAGVTSGGMPLYLGAHRRIVRVVTVKPASEQAAADGLAFARSKLGERYGFLPDVELALGLSGRWQNGALNCSEYCALIVHAMGVPGVRFDAGISPAELLASMDAAGCVDVSRAWGVLPEPAPRRFFGGNL